MTDDHGTERAAQEHLAAKLSQENQQAEELNGRAAAALAVWKQVSNTVYAKCHEWNAITNEETLTCKETPLGDLRIRCAGGHTHIYSAVGTLQRRFGFGKTRPVMLRQRR